MLSLLMIVSSSAWAQSGVPSRQIPPSVLTELRVLENRFELALSLDCDPDLCFSKGCTYVDHAVADQPRSASLPGLDQDNGPGSVVAQEYLTQARCSFAHEEAVDPKDAQALVRRLQAKLSKAWTVVAVDAQKLEPLPVLEPAEEIDEEETEPVVLPPPQPAAWSAGVAARELWTSLLPHFYWMIGLCLLTFAGAILIWSWRRVGRASPEEQALLTSLGRADDGTNGAAPVEVEADEDALYVAEQTRLWKEKLAAMDPEDPPPELQGLVRELLYAGDMALLAKAVLTFPEAFPTAFPSGGELTEAKLELAEYLKTVDTEKLPADADFFSDLNRHALSAALTSQSDARIVRSLREEFGASGLAELIGSLPARPGALLFAMAPGDEQHEVSRLLAPRQVAGLAERLLRSNRMSPSETSYLFEVLTAAHNEQPLPPPPQGKPATDRGALFDAAGALSVLLSHMSTTTRSALFRAAIERFHGSVPTWYRGILVADMLLELPDETRNDLLLEVDVNGLSAWISLLDANTRQRLLSTVPDSLRSAIAASSAFASRTQQVAMADKARRELAEGFQRQIARAGIPFERTLDSGPPAASPGGP